MLELYHSINSVCAQKVRIALAEKGLQATEHLMTLRGDQFDPAYMKIRTPWCRRSFTTAMSCSLATQRSSTQRFMNGPSPAGTSATNPC
jgi:hypothetical protein